MYCHVNWPPAVRAAPTTMNQERGVVRKWTQVGRVDKRSASTGDAGGPRPTARHCPRRSRPGAARGPPPAVRHSAPGWPASAADGGSAESSSRSTVRLRTAASRSNVGAGSARTSALPPRTAAARVSERKPARRRRARPRRSRSATIPSRRKALASARTRSARFHAEAVIPRRSDIPRGLVAATAAPTASLRDSFRLPRSSVGAGAGAPRPVCSRDAERRRGIPTRELGNETGHPVPSALKSGYAALTRPTHLRIQAPGPQPTGSSSSAIT